MADIKISQLTEKTTLLDTDNIVVDDTSVTYKSTFATVIDFFKGFFAKKIANPTNNHLVSISNGDIADSGVAVSTINNKLSISGSGRTLNINGLTFSNGTDTFTITI